MQAGCQKLQQLPWCPSHAMPGPAAWQLLTHHAACCDPQLLLQLVSHLLAILAADARHHTTTASAHTQQQRSATAESPAEQLLHAGGCLARPWCSLGRQHCSWVEGWAAQSSAGGAVTLNCPHPPPPASVGTRKRLEAAVEQEPQHQEQHAYPAARTAVASAHAVPSNLHP